MTPRGLSGDVSGDGRPASAAWPPLPRPRAVLFDWDNTLVDTWPCIRAALNATLRAMGQPEWTIEEFRSRLGPSMRDSFPQMFGHRWQSARDIFYAAFEESHLATLQVADGAGELVAALADAGLVLGVVSNKTGSHLRREVEHLGWSRYFHRVVGATDAPRDKPAAEPVALALAGSGVDPGADVWFVGDSITDMECAHKSGCLPVLVRAEPAAAGEFDAWPPHCHLPDCRAVIGVVRERLFPATHV